MFPAAREKTAGMLTLSELKNMTETTQPKQKMLITRELRSTGKLIAERNVGECARIAAYRNGYAVYHAGRDATVFRIHACSGYSYDSCRSPFDISRGHLTERRGTCALCLRVRTACSATFKDTCGVV